jgi:hypothetical protein
MKTTSVFVLAILAATLGGCAVVPLEPPVAYGPPVVAYRPPPPVVVVQPAYRYRGYYGGHRHGYWR